MNKENATYVDGTYLHTLDDAVKYLENCKANGQNVYIKFNGHNLYSSNVTLDSAYMQVIGMTKEQDETLRKEERAASTPEEKEAVIEKWNNTIKQHQQEAKETATKIDAPYMNTIDDAVNYLDKCKKDGQNVYIEFNGHRLYSSDVTLDSAYMQVVGLTKAEDTAIAEEVRRATTPEEKKAAIDKWNNTIKQHQQEAKETATLAESPTINTIDDAVEYLDMCKKNGQNVYVNFNGHKLYSSDVTLDSAYMEVIGMTKEQDEAFRKEEMLATTPEEKKAVFEKWNNTRNQFPDKQDVLKSAIEATEDITRTTTIDEQEKILDELSLEKDERLEEMEKK